MSTLSPAPFNVFVDSDGPVADFRADLVKSGLPIEQFKYVPGIYLWLPITSGAEYSLSILKEYDDKNLLRTWILTKTPKGSPYAYTEKVLWYRRNFPWLEDRVVLAHDKSLLGTADDILFDDRPHKGNASLFRGTFVLFKEDDPVQSWAELLNTVAGRW
jgi:5'(3')-deoxyribonucleotidase